MKLLLINAKFTLTVNHENKKTQQTMAKQKSHSKDLNLVI